MRRNEINQVMWYTPSFFRRHFCGGDLNTLINLDRIAIDYFAADSQRQVNGQRALAGSSRSNDSDDAGSAGVPPAFFLQLKVFVGMTHPREMISRITIPSQMMASNRMAPII